MGKLTTIIAAAVIATASTANAQETIITETTTTVVSETNFDALEQAYKTLKFLNGKEMKLSGELYKGQEIGAGVPLEYTLVTNGMSFIVTLDDGRKTSEKAKSCKPHNQYDFTIPQGSKCKVTMDAEVFTNQYGQIQLTAVVWNVEFLN